MINHARNLLINIPGERIPDGTVPFDVYIPEWNGITLNEHLRKIYNTLFGTGDDYVDVCIRAYKYLCIVAASGYSHLIDSFDSRKTYSFPKYKDAGIPKIIISDSISDSIKVSGTAVPWINFRSHYKWNVHRISESEVSIYSYVDNETKVKNISESRLLGHSQLYISKFPDLDQCGSVEAITASNPTMKEVYSNILAFDKDLIWHLFDMIPRDEPFKTCKYMFEYELLPTYKLAAVIIAYIHRCNYQL